MAKIPDRVLKLEVPLVVRICETTMTLKEVIAMTPGTIIELPTEADARLDLLIGNHVIGAGKIVKVGERFGVSVRELGSEVISVEEDDEAVWWDDDEEFDPEAFADALLAAQG